MVVVNLSGLRIGPRLLEKDAEKPSRAPGPALKQRIRVP